MGPGLFKKPPSHSRKQLEEWLGTLEISAEAVGDVGGKKLPVPSRVKSWQVKRFDILDLPEYDLNQPWKLPEIYDVVFCLEVFEYIYNPWQAMKNLHLILKTGGILYASFHFIYPHHGPEGMDYLRYTQWGVDKLLEEAGFSSWTRLSRGFRRPWGITSVYLGENMKWLGKIDSPMHRDQGYLVKAIK